MIEAGDELVLGVRPEDVRVGEGTADDRRFEAEVVVVEPMGNENIIHLRFDGAADGEEFVATTEGAPNVGAGDRIDVAYPESTVHLFDGATGEALENRELSFSGTPDGVLP